MVGGMLKGLAEQILAGQFGTPEAAKLVEQSAMQGAQALTYAPRTEQGQEQVEAVGSVARNLIPLAGLQPQMGAIAQGVPRGVPAGTVMRSAAESTARTVGGEAAAAATVKAMDSATRVASLAGKGITTMPRRALEALQRDPAGDAPTPGTMGSAGAAGTDMATQRRALAADLPRPIQLTKGQATRDPAQLKFEIETAKLPEAGAPLRERFVKQNEQILQNFDAWIDQTGVEAPNLRAVGASVDRALVRQAASDKAAIRSAYKAAEAAGELEQPLQLQGLVRHLNDSAPDSATAPLLDVARRRAIQLGIAREAGASGPSWTEFVGERMGPYMKSEGGHAQAIKRIGEEWAASKANSQAGQLVAVPTTLKRAETYRQAINRATDFEATNVRQATIIKGLIDENTEGLGGGLYRQARALRSRYAQNYEDRSTIAKLLQNKRGTSDRQVAFEDVFDHAVLKGSLDDVRNVRRVLQRSGPDGAQAWRDLQGQTAKWIKEQAERNVATDSAGNRVVSPKGLDDAIRGLDADGRLDFIFGKQGAQRMRDIRDLAQIARTVPPEAAVNTSNTASTLLAGFIDVGTSGATGVPLPLATMVRVVRQHVKDASLRRRIEDALADLRKRAPNNKRNAPPVQEPNRTIH
jgi:hypothetical protein